jgi:hypothetical protein
MEEVSSEGYSHWARVLEDYFREGRFGFPLDITKANFYQKIKEQQHFSESDLFQPSF